MRSKAIVPLLMMSAFGLLSSSPAGAQSVGVTRISGSGTDTGNCSTSPCRTPAYAFAQTTTNGRIICTDSAAFPGLTINRSVAIDCSGTSSVIGPANQGLDTIAIDDSDSNTPGSVNVTLRGITVSSNDSLGRNASGIRFISGFSLTLENVTITNTGTSVETGSGVSFTPNRAARLIVSSSSIANVGYSNGAGIAIRPSGAGYAGVVLENVVLSGNQTGLLVDLGSSTASSTTNVVMNRSLVAGSAGNGVSVNAGSSSAGAGVTITNSTVNGNSVNGILANGARASIRVANTTIAGNSTGLQRSGGAIIATYGNNSLIGNGVNGSFNGFPSED